jgi:hypothetical protein
MIKISLKKLAVSMTLAIFALTIIATVHKQNENRKNDLSTPIPNVPMQAKSNVSTNPSLEIESDTTDVQTWLENLPIQLKEYSKEPLEAMLASFNSRQIAKYPSKYPDNPELLSEGVSQLSLVNQGNYFSINTRHVEQEHSWGIDGGIDTFTSSYFNAHGSLIKIADLKGPTQLIANDHFVLSIPAHESCMGMVADGSISLYDLKSQTESFHADLPSEGILRIEATDSSRLAPNIDLSVLSEKPDPKPKDCEVGSTVFKVTEEFKLRCDNVGKNCSLKKISSKKTRACQEIGGCD